MLLHRVVEKDSSVANIAGIASVEVGDALVRVEGRLVKGMGHAQLGLLVSNVIFYPSLY